MDQCWNVDEDAANAVKSRDPTLMSANSFADGMGRCFAISADGERMGTHVTDVMATCRDGSVGAPMVIKTRGGGDKPQEASRKRRLGEPVQVPGVKSTVNPSSPFFPFPSPFLTKYQTNTNQGHHIHFR